MAKGFRFDRDFGWLLYGWVRARRSIPLVIAMRGVFLGFFLINCFMALTTYVDFSLYDGPLHLPLLCLAGMAVCYWGASR